MSEDNNMGYQAPDTAVSLTISGSDHSATLQVGSALNEGCQCSHGCQDMHTVPGSCCCSSKITIGTTLSTQTSMSQVPMSRAAEQ